MRKFGLIGYPLGHSFSKKYFSEKFIRENITGCSYENYPLQDLTLLDDLIRNNEDLCGLNVTIPHKTGVIKYLREISEEAKEIGAVNVVRIKRNEGNIRLTGYNSDVKGIEDSIVPHLRKNITGAIVMGTGGSSRAVKYVLARLGIGVVSVSRTKKPGVITYSEIDRELINDNLLIINTTPAGMFPDIESKPDLDYSLLDKRHILFDLVYNPELTSFLKMGLRQGCTVISGLKMLYSQAERSWEIWNDENL